MITTPAVLPAAPSATSIVFSNPFERPLTFLALEVVVFTCFAFTAAHAVARFRQGERHHAFQWLVIFAYGVFMELIAFNFLHNYNHGQFTIQLYRNELPLYIPCVYLVLHYAGLKSVERLGLSRVPEALLVGFAICLLDVPFDILGVDAGFWSWSSTDPNLAYRFLGVPVTSFYWYMLFGALFAALCRAVKAPLARRSFAASVVAAPVVAVGILVTGVLAFLPFHALTALGIADGPIVTAHAIVCAAVAVFYLLYRRERARPLSPTMLTIVVGLHAFHLALLAVLWREGLVPQASAKLFVIAAAALSSLAIARGLPRGQRASSTPRETAARAA